MKSRDVLEVFKCNTSFFGNGSSEELGYKVGLQILVREHDRNRWTQPREEKVHLVRKKNGSRRGLGFFCSLRERERES